MGRPKVKKVGNYIDEETRNFQRGTKSNPMAAFRILSFILATAPS
jgi:hypothetical protein